MNCTLCKGKGEIVAATVKITYGMYASNLKGCMPTLHILNLCSSCSKTLWEKLLPGITIGDTHYTIENLPCP